MTKRLIILEGPDGGGKTTLAAAISAAITGAAGKPWSHNLPLGSFAVQNHGPYLNEHQIWKHYFDSMLPAYSGAREYTILDRCWLAEPIYGTVMRNGLNRLEQWQLRILEHVAAACRTTVIYCLPGLDNCLRSFRARKGDEYPQREQQIADIYTLYLSQAVGGEPAFDARRYAKSIIYNYTDNQLQGVLDAIQ